MAAKDTKKMEIHTCYTVKIKHQLDAMPDRKTKKLNISRKCRVDDRLMQQTAEICLEALRFCRCDLKRMGSCESTGAQAGI